MGFFDKLLGAANKVDDVKTTIEYNTLRDRRYDRAEELAAEGDALEAVVTGIYFKLNNEMTEGVFRLEWSDPAPRVAGVLFSGAAPEVLRLGSSVPVRVDGDTAVIDSKVMVGSPAPPSSPGRSARSAPEPGVVDTSLNPDLQRWLKKWARDRGTVTSFDRVDVMGLTTQNWNIQVTRSDGSRALVRRDFVPTYARWFVCPGADVPLVVDPKDPARVQVDWPLLATENRGGSWRDPVPEGSIAALTLVKGEPVEAMSTGQPLDLAPSADSVDAIEGVTLQTWATIEAALQKTPIAPAGYDAFASEQYGVPTGRWTEIKRQWEARQRSDWKIGAAFGEAFEVARKELKKKR